MVCLQGDEQKKRVVCFIVRNGLRKGWSFPDFMRTSDKAPDFEFS